MAPDPIRWRRLCALALSAAVVLILAWGVWPTPYRYTSLRLQGKPVRVNRLTGGAEYLTIYGWQPARTTKNEAFKLIEGKNLEQITGRLGNDGSQLRLSLYNGSSFRLHSILISLILPSRPNVIPRYRFDFPLPIEPFTATSATVTSAETDQPPGWLVIAAWGEPVPEYSRFVDKPLPPGAQPDFTRFFLDDEGTEQKANGK